MTISASGSSSPRSLDSDSLLAEQALDHPWLASKTNPDAATLPLLVSSLPYNGGGHTSSLAPAVSAASDSFVDSQGMSELDQIFPPARS